MNLNVLIPVVASAVYGVLLFVVLRQSPRSKVNQTFALYLLTMTVWSFGSFMVHANFPIQPPSFWIEFTIVSGGLAMPVVFFYFVQVFLDITKQRIWLYLGVGLCITISIATAMGYTVKESYVLEGVVYLKFGPGILFAGLNAYFFIGFSIFNLLREHRRAKEKSYRNRIRYPLIGAGVVMLGASTNFTPLGKYPVDITANLINALLIAYAIVRHELLDISRVVRKGMAYAAMAAGIAATYLLTIFVFERLVRTVLGYGAYLIPILVAVFASVVLRPLRGRVQTWIDRFFFRGRYEAQQMLHRLSQTATTILDLNVLSGMLLEDVTTTMHIAGACILLKEQGTEEFYIAAHGGLGEDVASLRLRRDHPLPHCMARQGKLLTAHEIDILPQFKALWGGEREDLERLGAELFVPLLIKGDLAGLFAFGPRLSGEGYSQDEKITLITLANQTAVAIENARLFEAAQHELAERERTEEQIKASLKEKEVLLKEIHHRVKNNLQVISSLLYLQSKNIVDERALEMFQDGRNRVRSMALVHERLYQSKDLARVDFAEYARSLANHLFRSYGVNSNVIKLKINVDGIFLGIDTAIPCGLIINELVSNSLKHAFPNGREGEIRIELRSDNDGQFILMVSDNGVGFPEDLDFRNTQSLGLQLVNTIVAQLEGTIELDRSGETAFKITFTEPKYKGRG